jgi:crotonobetainyl-CoA:carnitine CoA-transferase CaiB-like acyl-CoA transferase
MGREDLLTDARFTSNLKRLQPENAKVLAEIVAGWVKSKTAEEIISAAVSNCFPAAEVEDDDTICRDTWRRKRGSVILFKDDMYGELMIAGPSAQLSKTPSRTKWLARPIGYHNRIVLKKFLGLSDEEIRDLEKKKVIGTFDDRPGLKPPVYYNLDEDPVFNYGKQVNQ